MNRIKFTDAVRTYDGCSDFAIWCRKFEATAAVCDIEKIAALPMLLDGRAFDLFSGLTSEDQRSYDAVKAALSEAFGPDPQEAFEQFRSRSIQPGESIEEYMSSLRRLATVICMGQEPQEYFLRQAFLAGLPTEVSKNLLSEAGKENNPLQDLIQMARSLLRINTRTEKAVEPPSGGVVASASNVKYGVN